MKILKNLFVFSLAALFAVQTADAATQNKSTSKKTTTKQTTGKKKAASSFQQFKQNVGITYKGRNIAKNQQGQKFVQFHYDITNKSTKKAMKSLNWLVAFEYRNTVVFADNVNLDFGKKPLKASHRTSITLSVPLDKIDAAYRDWMGNAKVDLVAKSGANSVTFTDGSKIVVR